MPTNKCLILKSVSNSEVPTVKDPCCGMSLSCKTNQTLVFPLLSQIILPLRVKKISKNVMHLSWDIFDTSSPFALTITFIVAPGISCSFILIKGPSFLSAFQPWPLMWTIKFASDNLLQILLCPFLAIRLVPWRKQEEFRSSWNARKHGHQQLVFWNVSDLDKTALIA